jgi:glucose/mannose-6-phosphate isomerase
LINKSSLEKHDSQGMHKAYDIWPEIAKESYNRKNEKIKFNEISHIVFAGMGGSGAIGDIFEAILSKTDIHVTLVKGYHLPNTVNSKTLVIATSISGNTVETLAVLESAIQTDAKVIAFSSGGEMEKICIKNSLEYRKIKMKHSPRVSFPIFLYSMLKILESVLPIKKEDILESILELERTNEKIQSKNLTETNISLNIAKQISGIPLIYYPWGLQAAAIRFKNSLQENTKMHAITEDVIEACHNGIVAWDKKSNINPILIQGSDDYIKTKERWEILKELFKGKNIKYNEIHSKKGNILSKIINLIYVLDYSTIYKAVLLEIDPTPVGPIDFVKNKLKS